MDSSNTYITWTGTTDICTSNDYYSISVEGPVSCFKEPIEMIEWPKRQEEEMKRGLYEVIIVDPENGAITENLEIAKSERSALIKVFAVEPYLEKDPDDYDILITRLMDVREAKTSE